MTIKLLITILIAIVGWILAIAQFCYKENGKKRIYLHQEDMTLILNTCVNVKK